MGQVIPFHPPDGYNYDKLPYPVIPFHGTSAEQIELVQAVRRNFPECGKQALLRWGQTHHPFGTHPEMCHYHSSMGGSVYEFHLCDGHAFLNEVDEPGRLVEWTVPQVFGQHHGVYGQLPTRVTRLDRLMFARKLRAVWLAKEGVLHQCPACNAIYQVRHECPEERSSVRLRLGRRVEEAMFGKEKDPENDIPW